MSARSNHFRALVISVATFLAVGLLALLDEGRAYGLVCGSSWTTVPLAPGLKLPRALAPIAPNDIWIVGNQGDTQTPLQAEHWNGSSWTIVSTPNVGSGDKELNGADAVASNDVWAVGASSGTTANRYKTLIEHWNGSQWQVVASPNVGTNNFNTLTSVDASSRTSAWAVGSYRTAASLGKDTVRSTLITRWNGTSWNIVPSPNPGTLSNSLLGVAAIGTSNVWAVGWKLGAQGLRSLVLHYDGTAWTEVAVPTAGTGENVLTGISAVSANDIWAAGYYDDGSQQKTLTLHYNGNNWIKVPSANGGGGVSILRDISAFSPTDVWAVGLEYREALKHYIASTQHWNGSVWSTVPSAISAKSATQSEMFSVAKAPGTSKVWAAGRPQDMEVICPTSSTTQAKLAQMTKTSTNSAAPAEAATQMTKTSPTTLDVPVPNTAVVPAALGTSVTAIDKAAATGISETTLTRGGIIADFDNDGRPDIFLGRHDSNTAQLFINDGSGHFQEIDQGTFVKTDRHGCDAADVNGDGLKDIFCSTGASRGTAAKLNELYVQQLDHTFVNQAGQYGVLDPFSRGRLGTFINANDDDQPDLLVANEADRLDGLPSANQLFINQGGSKFRSAPEYGLEREMGFGGYAGNNASVADLDKDSWQDLILVTPSGLRVYHNNQGTGFTNVAASAGLGQTPADVTLADVNGDTWPDVIEVSANELRILLNKNGTFSSVSSTPLQFDVSVAAGDVNGDDRPDIYVMRGKDQTGANAPDQVYLNNGTGTGFTQMTSSIPSTSQGAADFVAPIDYDGNDLTDFLVLNGAEAKPGPVQLIAFFPAS